jgi:hypothetical protein
VGAWKQPESQAYTALLAAPRASGLLLQFFRHFHEVQLVRRAQLVILSLP